MTFCPHCGYNLEADKPVEHGPWRVTPCSIEHQRKPIAASPRMVSILHSLAAARGAVVDTAVLAERAGYEGDDPANWVAVAMSLLRKRLPTVPFEAVYGFGYRWRVA